MSKKPDTTTTTAVTAAEGGYPLLEAIDSPADLRRLPVGQLPEVAAEMRRFLIDCLSTHPGHFASSMGTVELTLALHYVFNTPYDRIVWDVGHQAYGHKLLTGRRDRFDTLRRQGGLSGFPAPRESEYDTFTAGHASNSISAALGMSVASNLKAEEPHRNVVAVIGDASISGGLAFEALNNAANTDADLLIILNDNDMSIDRPTGSLNSYLGKINTSKAYNTLRERLYRTLKKLRLVTPRQRGFIMRFNNSLKSLINREQNIFEGLNIRYFGPFDGHDTERLVRVLSDIKDMRGPRLLHVRTVKGRGYAPAEQDPTTWHAPGKFDPATGERAGSSGKPQPPKFQDVFGNTLAELAADNPRIVGITAAMPSGTSLNRFAKVFPDRSFDVGISEGHAVTFAGGLAKDGMLPFVAIYSSFLQRAYDSIIHDVAIEHLPVIFCIDRAGIVGEDGPTHHGAFDLGYMALVPGMSVAAPADEHMLRNLMFTAQAAPDGPMAIRYPRGRGSLVDWRNEPMQLVERGRGRLLRDGGPQARVAVLALGVPALDALEAANEAARQGVEASVWDMVWLKPIDTGIVNAVARGGYQTVITVEDGSVAGGLSTAVASALAAAGSPARHVALGMPEGEFVAHGTVAQLKHACGYDTEGILKTIMEAAGKALNISAQ